MYEDAPQELVHDLIVRGGLRRPCARPAGDRHRRGDLVDQPREAIARYHARCTSRRNIVVAAAGNVEHERARRARCERGARAAQQRWRGSARRRRRSSQPPPPRLRFQRKDTEQYHVCLGAPGISRSDRRRFAASLLDAILGGSASSRLFQEIREKRGMAYAVYRSSRSTRTPARSASTSARARTTSPRRSRSRRSRSPTSPAGTCPSASSRARRRTSRAGSCSRWSRRRRA